MPVKNAQQAMFGKYLKRMPDNISDEINNGIQGNAH
jgi:hypothetical protein